MSISNQNLYAWAHSLKSVYGKYVRLTCLVLCCGYAGSCSNPNAPYAPGGSSSGGSGSSSQPVRAAFDYKVTHPLTVVLTNRSENATSYNWTFGDGESSASRNPTHRFKTKGVYKVTLTVGNSTGLQSASATIKVENPTKIFITGFSVEKIPYENQYYRIQVIDDDFFTTTWAETGYMLLSSAILPFKGSVTPVLLNGLSEDDYYVTQLYYNTKSSGSGTRVAAFKMMTEQILQYPDHLTGASDKASVTTYFSYQ